MYNCYVSITSIEACSNVYSMHYLIIHYRQDIIIRLCHTHVLLAKEYLSHIVT